MKRRGPRRRSLISWIDVDPNYTRSEPLEILDAYESTIGAE